MITADRLRYSYMRLQDEYRTGSLFVVVIDVGIMHISECDLLGNPPYFILCAHGA